jgi:NAD(P) transhydrogenase
MFKILFHAETLEILGIHIIGRSATELIHIGQVAMTFNAKIDYFIDHVFNYPTYAEGYRVAALNGLNKIKQKS